jgi:hypothetical protein
MIANKVFFYIFALHTELLFAYNDIEVIIMAIRDRGMVKWQAAFQLSELVKGQRDLWRDTERIAKPILDEYQSEEFDQRIVYAIESNYSVKVKVWSYGFITDLTGRIHYVDPRLLSNSLLK